MTYPNYPAQQQYPPQGPGAPGYPGQPDPYAQPQGQPAYGAQPGYPQQPQPAQPGYGQQPPPPAPVPSGPPPTMSDFYEQPAGGGNSLGFEQVGTRYSGVILRTVTRADIEVATEMGDRTKIAKYQDGRVKLIMKVPILLDQPHPKYPTREATWIVKAGDRNELLRAMEAAGAQPDPELGFMRPGAGDHIMITYTHDQPSRNGMNPKKVKRVDYVVGNGVAPELPVAAQAQAMGQVQPGYQQAPPQQPSPYGQAAPQYYSPTPPPTQPQQPQYQQVSPQPQYDPALAYQQATGQPMQPYQGQLPPPGPYGQPQADWNPAYQQGPPMPASPAQAGYPSGPAQPSGAPSPSNPVPGGPPPDWPADVPFQPGLTVEQARTAQAVKLGMAQQAPQQ